MRRILLLVGVLVMVCGGVMAEEAVSGANKNPVFGSGPCGSPFSCTAINGDKSFLINTANQCSAMRFGTGRGFDNSTSLDTSNCITSKNDQKATEGFTMSIKCCVVPDRATNTCQLTCTKYGLR